MDAAASRELSPALREHLAKCKACRTAFAEEQSLYAAIDTGLHAAANPEVPSTLLPRVRVALNNEQLPQANLKKWVFAGAVLACGLIVAITLQLRHRESSSPTKVAIVQSPAQPRANRPLPSAPAGAHPVLQPLGKVETAHPMPTEAGASLTAEVLVPDEERAAFEKFLARERVPSANSSAAVLLVPEAPKELVPLPAVEIASLKVLPLNGEEDGQGEF